MRYDFSSFGLKVLQFNHLLDCKKLVHGVFTRHGGVSHDPFKSLNIGLTIEDKEPDVLENRLRIQNHLKISHLKWTYQIHGDNLQILENDQQETNNIPGDGLLTSIPSIGLGIKHADCQVAIFYDPIKHALANVHSGWRGNVLEIYKKTLISMQFHYGSKPENILVGISPSLGPNYSEFINYRDEFPESFQNFQIHSNYFNLWEISRWQLEMAGILSHHIEIAGICTYEQNEDWFSYRREKITGRNGTIAALL